MSSAGLKCSTTYLICLCASFESFKSYSKALQEVHRITDHIEEERSGLSGLQQLVSFLTLTLSTPTFSMAGGGSVTSPTADTLDLGDRHARSSNYDPQVNTDQAVVAMVLCLVLPLISAKEVTRSYQDRMSLRGTC